MAVLKPLQSHSICDRPDNSSEYFSRVYPQQFQLSFKEYHDDHGISIEGGYPTTSVYGCVALVDGSGKVSREGGLAEWYPRADDLSDKLSIELGYCRSLPAETYTFFKY